MSDTPNTGTKYRSAEEELRVVTKILDEVAVQCGPVGDWRGILKDASQAIKKVRGQMLVSDRDQENHA